MLDDDQTIDPAGLILEASVSTVEEPSVAELDRIAPDLGTGGCVPPRSVASAARTAPEPATYIKRAHDARPPFADVATPAEVLAADEAMQAAIAAAHAVDAAAHPGDEPPASPLPADVREMVGKGKGAAAALDAFLSSDHPVASGSYLRREDTLRPQAYVREALAETYAGLSQLANVETRALPIHAAFSRVHQPLLRRPVWRSSSAS